MQAACLLRIYAGICCPARIKSPLLYRLSYPAWSATVVTAATILSPRREGHTLRALDDPDDEEGLTHARHRRVLFRQT